MTPNSLRSGARRDGSHIVRYERLYRGSFYADFRRDARLYPEVYHCIVQRDGSTEILSWSQFRTLEAAKDSGQRELERRAQEEADGPTKTANIEHLRSESISKLQS